MSASKVNAGSKGLGALSVSLYSLLLRAAALLASVNSTCGDKWWRKLQVSSEHCPDCGVCGPAKRGRCPYQAQMGWACQVSRNKVAFLHGHKLFWVLIGYFFRKSNL